MADNAVTYLNGQRVIITVVFHVSSDLPELSEGDLNGDLSC